MNAMAAATYLGQRGVPFRQAHEVVAHAVQSLRGEKLRIAGPVGGRIAIVFCPAFGADVHQHLTLDAVLACHDVVGGTAPHGKGSTESCA